MADTACPKRLPPTFIGTPEITQQIAASARVAPLYEAGLYEYVIRRHYSLQRNKNLKCEYEKYKKNIEKKKTEPFEFPNDRDLHFYNCMIRFKPSETVYKKATFRKSLKPGPGVDYGGQMPIPQELMMKRLASVKEEKTKKRHSVEKGKKDQNKAQDKNNTVSGKESQENK